MRVCFVYLECLPAGSPFLTITMANVTLELDWRLINISPAATFDHYH